MDSSLCHFQRKNTQKKVLKSCDRRCGYSKIGKNSRLKMYNRKGFILAYLKIVDMNWRTSAAEGQLDKKIQTVFLLLANVCETASLSVWNGVYLREDGHLYHTYITLSHHNEVLKGGKTWQKRILDLEKSVDNMQMMWGRWIPSFVNVNCMQCYISCLGWQ